MFRFEVGSFYEANEWGVDPIEVIKRTAKTILVHQRGSTWRMRIRVDEDGNEYVSDSTVPLKWRDGYTYQAKYIAE